jgi:hypothetical protein
MAVRRERLDPLELQGQQASREKQAQLERQAPQARQELLARKVTLESAAPRARKVFKVCKGLRE